MKSCPRCHLLLETIDAGGSPILACRSCGGAWLRADERSRADDISTLRELAAANPGVSRGEAFAGLAMYCPDCRTVTLSDAPNGSHCERCGGLWLDAATRDGLIAAAEPPPPAPAPMPPAEPVAAPAPDPAPSPEPAAPAEARSAVATAQRSPAPAPVTGGHGCPLCLERYFGGEVACPKCDVLLVDFDFEVLCPECGVANSYVNAGCRQCAAALRTPEMLDQLYGRPHNLGDAPPDFPDVDEASTDPFLDANAEYVGGFGNGGLPRAPKRRVAVLTCIDARIPVKAMLGMGLGDANVLRNAGGLVTPDVLRTLVIAHHVLGVRELLIVQHTDCGLHKLDEDALRQRLIKERGPAEPSRFLAFDDLQDSVRDQVARAASHPWLRGGLTVRGFVYDVHTGRLTEVKG